ncbi:aldo/keto reductase [Plantactinospora sp. B5E13]|uniref:aldo/keto reductase n=1 Tax=unclassified Plantactinospora TaxID=2631981 RepID=UPI00325CF960
MTSTADETTLTVGAAAAEVGLTAYTLRWYEQEGLVEPVGRDSAGRRRYTGADMRRLTLLTRLRRTGMPVRDMRRYAELARRGDQTRALAWLLAQGDDVLPIPGTKRVRYLEENVAAGELTLSPDQLARLTASVPPAAVAGERYPEQSKRFLRH